MKTLSRFFEINKRLSQHLTPDHVHEANVFGAYRKIGTIVLSHPRVLNVVDVGAGKQWQFPTYYKDWYKIYLTGLDIDGQEMQDNTALDQRIVCDATGVIPLADGSIDLVMAHSGIEHFKDNERFLENVFRMLRPGGFLLAQFPGRYALFAMANRLLPGWLAKKALNLSMGDTDVLGFKTYYDRTNYSSFKKLGEYVGFKEIYHTPGYFSSSYFEFFSPLFFLSYTFDTIVYGLGIRELASYNLFLLQKPADGVDAEPLQLYAWK